MRSSYRHLPYTATAEVPLLLGATPVFIDVDPRTFQIDPLDLEKRIVATRAAGKLKPRAIIGVDLFGQPADWPELGAIARRHDLFLLDDLAQSFGASLGGVMLGRPSGRHSDQLFSRQSRWAPTVTAVRCSPSRRSVPNSIAASEAMAKERRDTRYCELG